MVLTTAALTFSRDIVQNDMVQSGAGADGGGEIRTGSGRYNSSVPSARRFSWVQVHTGNKWTTAADGPRGPRSYLLKECWVHLPRAVADVLVATGLPRKATTLAR